MQHTQHSGLIFLRGSGVHALSVTLTPDGRVLQVRGGVSSWLALSAYGDQPLAWAGECGSAASGLHGDPHFVLGPVGLRLTRRHAERTGLDIGTAAAHALHVALGDAKVGEQKVFAARVLGRPVQSFACLSELDAQRLHSAAAYQDLLVVLGVGEVAA